MAIAPRRGTGRRNEPTSALQLGQRDRAPSGAGFNFYRWYYAALGMYQMGIRSEFRQGMRVTDEATLAAASGEIQYTVYSIRYAAASDGQTLAVRWTMMPGGAGRREARALEGGRAVERDATRRDDPFAILQAVTDFDPDQIYSHQARFSAPVFPGDTPFALR